MDLTGATWYKSSRSSGSGPGDCVEVAVTGDAVGVRDSKDRTGGIVALTPAAWAGFAAAVKSGRFGTGT